MARLICKWCGKIIRERENGKMFCSDECKNDCEMQVCDTSDYITKSMRTDYRTWAKDRGLIFEIDVDIMREKYDEQGGLCALTGIPLQFKPVKTASLDRIDNNIGYTSDNIQWVLKDINKMRNNLTVEHFIEMCEAVAKYKQENLNGRKE